ncbi:hypothetical protein MBRA1_003073 [Malassezia brasiliensis]|uniref:Uncharacterized protein n=1 Tax=Malassezia brasiliensis TaxID=1821822 RepID=A0AAF0DWX3_9BASI|nr:hypothetical protein MBRA1_003073 [Malassezia brasiliensis]
MAQSAGTASDASFTPPVGYRRSEVPAMNEEDTELWVIRVPDEVDAHKLDGVTLSLDALQSTSRTSLASVDVGKDTYDLFVASTRRTDTRTDNSAQLIDMAGGEKADVFVDDNYFAQERGVGIATDLNGIVPLLPTSRNTLKVAPKRLHRRMYMARRAPRSAPDAPVHPVPHQAHVQPWDRLKGQFIPAGARAETRAHKSEKKKRKSSDASTPRKKK